MNTLDEALAKIAMPCNRQIYPRTSLFAKLDEAVHAPGIWISGPPGSGKTTLISSYLKEKSRTHLWYQIDDGDTDVATFFWYMRLAAKKVSLRAYSKLEPYSSAYQGSLKAFSARYFENLYALLPPNFLIVLDDYHLTRDDTALDSVIVQAISTLPQHGNIVVVSREQPSPAFCRLLGNEKLRLLGWDDLRLTRAEVRGVSMLRQPGHSAQCIDKIEARIDGWAAGLIFQLQDSYAHNCDDVQVSAHGHEALFGYFANEVLSAQDYESQNILMQLALMPLMTQEMARRLTGSQRAVPLIKWLQRHNNFVELQALAVPTYRFHPLFRDFLLDRLVEKSSFTEITKLQQRAAELLEESGFRGAALKLYASVGDWGKVSELIRVDAPIKFRNGRIKSLEKSIRELPADIVAKDPWLSYWLGASHMFLDAQGAHRLFSNAFRLFQESGDAAGSLAAWSGAVNSLLAEWGDMKSLNEWIGPGEKLLPADAPLPQDNLGAHAVTAMCAALSICRPHSPDLEKYILKTHELITARDDRTFCLMSCNLLLVFYAWQGELTKMQLLVDSLRPDMEGADVSDAHRVMWAAAVGWFDLVSGRAEDCLSVSLGALELIRNCGVHIFDYKFYGMATQANLMLGRPTEAQVYIDAYLKVIPGKANLLRFHAHQLSAWQAWLAGNSTGAGIQLLCAERFLKAAGSAPFVSAKTDIAAAILHFEAGESVEGLARLASAERIANATGSGWLQYHCCLLRASFERRSGDHERCLQYLRRGLEIGRVNGLVMTDWWDAPNMSRLCEVALVNDIETEHARRIIDVAGLRPVSAGAASDVWPWPVMIEVLGQFRLTVNGQVVTNEIAGKKKAVELLKVLVALGGQHVAAARIADALWPDADGDNAGNSLKTTVHRLRKLLGVPGALELKDKTISLDTRYCWVDAFVFAALAETPRSSSDRFANQKKALKLYKGPLLATDEVQPWMIAPRAQAQKVLHRMVMDMGERYERRQRWGKAIRLYRDELRMNPVDEQACRHLMQCYHRAGRDEDALASYKQCCSALKSQLASNPSPKTRTLARAIGHA